MPELEVPAGTAVTSTRIWCADAQRCHRGAMGTLTRFNASSAGAHGRSALALAPSFKLLAECMPRFPGMWHSPTLVHIFFVLFFL